MKLVLKRNILLKKKRINNFDDLSNKNRIKYKKRLIEKNPDLSENNENL